MKIRPFPTNDEKERLKVMFDQYRWHYNCTLLATHIRFKDTLTDPLDYSHISIRNLLVANVTLKVACNV